MIFQQNLLHITIIELQKFSNFLHTINIYLLEYIVVVILLFEWTAIIIFYELQIIGSFFKIKNL